MAPNKESKRLPRNPAPVMMKEKFESWGREKRLIRMAPMREARRPRGVIPPEEPGSTFLRFFNEMGFIRERSPISVPHVSELAAARDPRKR